MFLYRCTSNELKPTAENGISNNSLSRKDTEKEGRHNSSVVVAGVSNDSCDDKTKLSGVDTTAEVDFVFWNATFQHHFYRKITKAACNFMFILVLIHPFVNYPLNPSISFYLWIKNSVMTNNVELKSICTKHNDESTGNEPNQLSSNLSRTNSETLHNTTTNTHDKENG